MTEILSQDMQTNKQTNKSTNKLAHGEDGAITTQMLRYAHRDNKTDSNTYAQTC